MVRLNRSMMERYEIANRRPSVIRAALFGLDPMMLCAAARLLDRCNELGGDLGAVCISGGGEVETLRAQDGMFTLLVRGEREDGSPIREERVVQSILEVEDVDGGLRFAARPELDLLMLSVVSSSEELVSELAVLTRFLHARWKAKLSAPQVLFLDQDPVPGIGQRLRDGIVELAQTFGEPEFVLWLKDAPFQVLLVDSLFGELSDSEFEKVQRDMNYQDHFLLWAEPQLKCVAEFAPPEVLALACETEDFSRACEQKRRILDSLAFLCTALGFLCGMDSFAQVLRDEQLRSFIGHAFFDELLPALPWPREEITSSVISAFSRLETSSNEISLLKRGNLLRGIRWSLLPSIYSFAQREFESPPLVTLGLSAAIMLYAGARRNERNEYLILRGKDAFVLRDDPAILEAFSSLSHDMPAETLTYAVLADRDLWGEDLREIDGLELRVALDIASIQRVGLRETLRLRKS